MVDTTEETLNQTNKDGFGWYQAIYSLSGENILNMDQVVKKSLVEVFNFMTYTIVLNNKREQEFKKNAKL